MSNPIRMPVATHRRLKVASAEEGLSLGKMIDLLLDQRDDRIRRVAAQQASPLHRPRNMEQF